MKKFKRNFGNKKSITIKTVVRQIDVSKKDLCFWNVRLIAFQDGINDATHFSGNSSNTGQMMFAVRFLFLVIDT